MRPRSAAARRKGTVLTEVDDAPGMGKDARIEWKAPADGTYSVQIADLHARGGETFPYVLLAEEASSRFLGDLRPGHDERRAGRSRAALRPPDAAARVQRRRELLACEELPPGVSASPLAIPPR